MNKLPLIIKREYLAKVRNKSFVIMTFLSPILMVGMILLIAYLTQLNDNEERVIAVLNDSGYFSNEFIASEATSYVNFQDLTLAEAKDSTLSLGYYGLVYLPSEPNLEQVAQRTFFYSKEAPSSIVLNKLENTITSRLRQERLRELGLSPKEYAEMDRSYNMNIETFDGLQNIKGINEIKAIIGGAFGYLIMMFIIIYGGFVMRSVIEEKTSRIIEVIISSVKPFHLMMGKIIGTSLAGITQFAIWIVSGAILLFIGLTIFDIDPASLTKGGMAPGMAGNASVDVDAVTQNIQLYAQEIFEIPIFAMLIFFIIYFVLGYLIYSSIYAAIGAAVDNETDTQQFIFPVILPLMLAIYVGFFSVFSNPNGPIAVAFSLFPLTSPIVMLMRLPWGIGEGGVPVWQLISSILILIATFIGIVWMAAKIYRVGILMYGKKPSYKELYKWLKYSS
ncbi:ABC transporter permease [Maribacter arcticus]|uniref:ABC-2 type transport system permease protein n=1 Tax=Maribacter arcticus TaxID=561365 RepID=A0A1T4ZVQ2_9FLAO|nr:ABC transporter permease [Maribacter arcticus]SKB26766.1 ABC-2 type transport system permease protein [Maribacter arcticus]|tara:strand:+ start:1040 stop:2383 length:1344 start_codon:yes stop_codon:yes gene_type:complete